jgi:hypothetical protein
MCKRIISPVVLHNEELHNLYCSPIIIRMIKVKEDEMGRAYNMYVRKGIHVGYSWEIPKEGGQDVGGWIILSCILERENGVMWTGLSLRIGITEGSCEHENEPWVL